jgi:RNA polymerase sigma factor (sigma-70 family)
LIRMGITNIGATLHDPRTLLSERERQVLRLLADGLSAKQIAYDLGITQSTVSQHISRIYDKLDVHNAVAAVRVAIRTGFIAA